MMKGDLCEKIKKDDGILNEIFGKCRPIVTDFCSNCLKILTDSLEENLKKIKNFY